MFNYRKHHDYHGSIFSFGAGVQSTAILLLIKYEPERLLKTVGHLPKHIIFADTGAESEASLRNFEKCKELLPIYRVKNWKRNAINKPDDIPVYFDTGLNNTRKCTTEWKVKPINDATRKLYPTKSKKRPVAMWLGISTDEITRMKESWVKSIENVFPLIELGLSRQDCYQILKQYNWEVAKSSCYMCPYQVKRWHENPELDKAIAYEKELQRVSQYREKPFLHPAAIPLGEAVKMQLNQTNLFTFQDECEGHCGV